MHLDLYLCAVMKLNKDIQKLADERARKEGYFCASYYGRDGEKFIFLPMHADSQRRIGGLFVYIVVQAMKARIHRELNYNVLAGIKRRDFYRGRTIYKDFVRKYDHNDFANDEEREYISAIVQIQSPGYDVPIDQSTLYNYLEIADRFGLMLDLIPCEWSMQRDDGWEYYLRLKSGKLKERTLTSADVEEFEIRNLYEEAFPEEERLPWKVLMRLTDAMPLDFTAYYDLENFVGLTIVLPRENYNWFWYFAVKKQLRGKGYGQKILTHIINQYMDKRLILDMESPRQKCDNLDQRLRRTGFYLRNGFRDTEVEKTFKGITYTILMKGDGNFTLKDYDTIIGELRMYWTVLSKEKH